MPSQLLLLLVRRVAGVLAGVRADAVAAGAAVERAARVERRMALFVTGAREVVVAAERAVVAAERAVEAVERAAVTTALPGGIMRGTMELAAGACFYIVVFRVMVCVYLDLFSVLQPRGPEARRCRQGQLGRCR
jgi:hypothetical protein